MGETKPADEGVLQMFGFEPEKVVTVPPSGLVERDGKLWGHCFDGPNQVFVEVEVKLQPKTGYWYRRDSFDRDSVQECLENYVKTRDLVKGKRVLDLGANVGGFTRMAVEGGAAHVMAIEPCPFNYDILCKNSPTSENIHAAVGEDDSKDCLFYYANSKRNSVSSATIKRRNSTDVTITVPAIRFSNLLEEYKPEVLKCDIEGKEYDLLDSIDKIPDCVQVAAFEFHRGSLPYSEYPERFFPSSIWEMHDDVENRFGGLRDLLFIRK